MQQNQRRKSQFENSLNKYADQDVEQYVTANFNKGRLLLREDEESQIEADPVWSKASDQSQQDIC